MTYYDESDFFHTEGALESFRQGILFDAEGKQCTNMTGYRLIRIDNSIPTYSRLEKYEKNHAQLISPVAHNDFPEATYHRATEKEREEKTPKVLWGFSSFFFSALTFNEGKIVFNGTTFEELEKFYIKESWNIYQARHSNLADRRTISEKQNDFVAEFLREEKRLLQKSLEHKKDIAIWGDWADSYLTEFLTKVVRFSSLPTEQPRPAEQKEMNPEQVEELKQYFVAKFKGAGNFPNYFSYLINDLKVLQSDKDFARVALMIYNSKYIVTKPPTFNAWLKIFLHIVGVETKYSYRPNKLAPTELISKTFFYL